MRFNTQESRNSVYSTNTVSTNNKKKNLYEYIHKMGRKFTINSKPWWEIDVGDISSCYSNLTKFPKISSMRRSVRRFSLNKKCGKNNILYRGLPAYITKCEINKCEKKLIIKDIEDMRFVFHDNLAKFIGASLSNNEALMLFEHTSKGTLQDMILDEDFQMDWTFKLTFIKDILHGLQYLHNSKIRYHGSLQSRNCIVDSRYAVKLMNFSPKSIFKSNLDEKIITVLNGSISNIELFNMSIDLLWTSPELFLRKKSSNTEMWNAENWAKDIYSFGIIMQEIITREHPFIYSKRERDPTELIKYIYTNDTPEKFDLHEYWDDDCPKAVADIITDCIYEPPGLRPSTYDILETIKNICGKTETTCVVDQLMLRLSLYADNLEEMVEKRTKQLEEEKARSEELLNRSEELLYQMLPRSVAEDLRHGRTVQAQLFDCVTIYFSDVVGFTKMSSEMDPMGVVNLLNHLYSILDTIILDFDVYKIETIGDAYMVASGIPNVIPNHATEIGAMALHILNAVEQIRIPIEKGHKKLQIRIGIHSGPVCAGVVGIKMPRYCLFGDTVNTASRMESTGEAMKIQISQSCKNLLDNDKRFKTTERGTTEIKGKGKMVTYWCEKADNDNIKELWI